MSAPSKTYRDKARCPKCGIVRVVIRRTSSAGKMVNTYCALCGKMSIVLALAPKETP